MTSLTPCIFIAERNVDGTYLNFLKFIRYNLNVLLQSRNKMTETEQLERQRFCEKLGEFIEDVEKNVKETCTYLGWDFNSINNKKDEPFMTCPFNEGHRVPERTIEKHLRKCEWNTLGYTRECVPLPDSNLSSNTSSTIKFDMKLQHEVLLAAKEKNPELNIGTEEKFIPQTSDRLTSDFTSDERKAMYEYVIAHTVAPEIGKDITDINKPEKSKEQQSTTILELLAQERNLKRRRTKHRGVHTNKKSHIEILREIVEQQMEMYREYISDKYSIPNPDVDEKSNSCDNNNEDENVEENSVKNSKQEYHNKFNEDERFHQCKNNSRNYDKKSERYSKDYDEKSERNPRNYDEKSERNSRNYDEKSERNLRNYDEKPERHSRNYNEKSERNSRNNYNEKSYRNSRNYDEKSERHPRNHDEKSERNSRNYDEKSDRNSRNQDEKSDNNSSNHEEESERNSKNYNKKSERNSRHNYRDHSHSRKHSSHRDKSYRSSSRVQNSRENSKRRDYPEKDRDKNHPRDRNHDKEYSQNRKRDEK